MARTLHCFDPVAAVADSTAIDDRVMGRVSSRRRGLPLTGFRPPLRGRSMPDAALLDRALLRQVGLMIADRPAGSLTLAIGSIGFE